MSTPCEMQSLIVWMMAGEGDCAQGARLCWSEPKAPVTTLAFFVAQHMKTGRMRCSVSQSSCPDKVGLGIARSTVYQKEVVLDSDNCRSL